MLSKTSVTVAVLAGCAAAAPAPAPNGGWGVWGSQGLGSWISHGLQNEYPTSTEAASAASTAAASATASAAGTGSVVAPGYAADQSGNLPGYLNANAPFGSYTPTPITTIPVSFGPDSQIPAIATTAPTSGSGAADTQRSRYVTGTTTHGPFSGVPTTTGAVTNSPKAASVGTLPPNPTATYYNTNGALQNQEPAPYTPAGGLGTNGSLPRYMVNSDFDYESITLGLYQEWIELDTFNNGIAIFSEQDFADAGLTPEDISLIQFMAQQEQGHATLLSNMLGETAPPQCTYNYPYKNVREFVEFNAVLTRWGESGVWGFINHLDSREVGQLLAQSIATEARQEMIFRQFSGLHPMPVWFEAGIPQSWAWTYLAPYISSCPENTTRLAWQNFPALHVVNQANINRISPNDTADWERVDNRTTSPSITDIPQDQSCLHVNKTGYGCGPAIAHNRSEPLSFAGKQVRLEWDNPGHSVGPNNSYVTATSAGAPKYVAWVNQLNLTYTDLVATGPNSGYTYQPAAEVYQGGASVVNQTTFIALTDSNMFLTPFNLSMINPHVVALGLYAAG
ncbi:hypothetical protein AMS68_000094 [Peltaster fructicola]|uniref:Stress response protein Rds1 n=1 Tax=Peltaster fructicola TaxID=286661 RepID=A0A6H0XIM9_9PEZI|nr:hypothetical protein AMS68_000094 [Peltaster fructicola]